MKYTENDATYRGEVDLDKCLFSFNSPLSDEKYVVKLHNGADQKIKEQLEQLYEEYGVGIFEPNDLNSFDNPDYLYIACELYKLVKRFRIHLSNPSCKKFPFVGLVMKEGAGNDAETMEHQSGRHGRRGELAVWFKDSFLKAFVRFLCSFFDDNPRTVLCDPDDNIIGIGDQILAPVYRQKPFDAYFETRHDIPAIIITESIKFMLAHELAHVLTGHSDLLTELLWKKEEGYKKKLALIEYDADMIAVIMMLADRFDYFSETKTVLVDRKEFFKEFVFAPFSIYVLNTWLFSKDQRHWNKYLIRDYISGDDPHLPYLLRAGRMVDSYFEQASALINNPVNPQLRFSDDVLIDDEFIAEAKRYTLSMINAFDKAYFMMFARTNDMLDLFKSGRQDEVRRIIANIANEPIPNLSKHDMPYYLGETVSAKKVISSLEESLMEFRKILYDKKAPCTVLNLN